MKYSHKAMIAATMMFTATPAFGQATRTWVSGTGSDANPCSRTAPCQTFAGAISKTATNGEINALDPGGFGTINITKSITIDGRGPMASILASGTTGIIVNGPGIVVNLRNLTINGASNTIGNGIRIIDAARVNIENVVIENFAGSGTNGRGIAIETASNVIVSVRNSEIANTFNAGIHSNPSAGTVSLLVDNTRVEAGDFSAIQLRQNTNAVISRSTMVNSRIGSGVLLELSTNTATISNSVIANNSVGVFNGSGGSPTTRIYGTTITGNTTAGLTINGGTVTSFSNNLIRGNAGNEVPTSTIPAQ